MYHNNNIEIVFELIDQNLDGGIVTFTDHIDVCGDWEHRRFRLFYK